MRIGNEIRRFGIFERIHHPQGTSFLRGKGLNPKLSCVLEIFPVEDVRERSSLGASPMSPSDDDFGLRYFSPENRERANLVWKPRKKNKKNDILYVNSYNNKYTRVECYIKI